jgi:magnesium chelatase family protein
MTGISRTRGVVLLGVDGCVVDVEAHVSNGVSGFSVVGLADKLVGEARDRCRSAFLTSGLEWPGPKNTIGLSPAELPKKGPTLDLAIAAALLAASGQVPKDVVAQWVIVGELSLDGRLRPVRGALVAALAALRVGARRLIVPAANAHEAQLVGDLDVVGVRTLAGFVALARGEDPPDIELLDDDQAQEPTNSIDAQAGSIPDLIDVRGQLEARTALEIAAAGGHHLAMVGEPGIGKTLLAARLPGLLPALDERTSVEVTSIHSVAGRPIPRGRLITTPPFEAPHHTATYAALVGGGSTVPRIGMVSLAHRGVLFLDEAPEFRPATLEALRQPLESGAIVINRAGFHVQLPARFQLILAMNPCPCGYANSGVQASRCTCTSLQRRTYLGKVSGPLMDRIDVRVSLGRPTLADLQFGAESAESTAVVAARVHVARDRAVKRLTGTPWIVNNDVPGPELRRRYPLAAAAAEPLNSALLRGQLSPRGADRVARVAWTVADLGGHDVPTMGDVLTALAHRDGGHSWVA